MIDRLPHKLDGTRQRARQWWEWLPRRSHRLGGQLARFCWSDLRWWADTVALALETAGATDLYETLADWCKWNTRPLTRAERLLLWDVYGDSLDYNRIRIDEHAYLGPPQLHICYVSFHTINSWGPMRPDTLIHEAMHIWQFERYGAAYIPRALAAQRSPLAYDYGGYTALLRASHLDLGLDAFNFEQQADILADYWRLRHKLPARWLRPDEPADPAVYAYFVDLVRRG